MSNTENLNNAAESGLLQPRLVRQFVSDPEKIDDIIDEWHEGKIECEHLHEALGWTWEQYKGWVETSIIPLPNVQALPLAGATTETNV